jgi:hypothetical protein
MDAEDESHDDIDGLLFDTFRNVVETNGVNDGPNEDLINICFLLLIYFVVACKEGGLIRCHSSIDVH